MDDKISMERETCKGTTTKGKPCKLKVIEGVEYCRYHRDKSSPITVPEFHIYVNNKPIDEIYNGMDHEVELPSRICHPELEIVYKDKKERLYF